MLDTGEPVLGCWLQKSPVQKCRVWSGHIDQLCSFGDAFAGSARAMFCAAACPRTLFSSLTLPNGISRCQGMMTMMNCVVVHVLVLLGGHSTPMAVPNGHRWKPQKLSAEYKCLFLTCVLWGPRVLLGTVLRAYARKRHCWPGCQPAFPRHFHCPFVACVCYSLSPSWSLPSS